MNKKEIVARRMWDLKVKELPTWVKYNYASRSPLDLLNETTSKTFGRILTKQRFTFVIFGVSLLGYHLNAMPHWRKYDMNRKFH